MAEAARFAAETHQPDATWVACFTAEGEQKGRECDGDDRMKAIVLRLAYLPDLPGVGGNARHAHWSQGYRASQREQSTWYALLWEALPTLPPWCPTRRCRIRITACYPYEVRVDQDNLVRAYKPLLDVLKASRNNASYRYGVIWDDSPRIVLDYSVKVMTSEGTPEAPEGFTILEVKHLESRRAERVQSISPSM